MFEQNNILFTNYQILNALFLLLYLRYPISFPFPFRWGSDVRTS